MLVNYFSLGVNEQVTISGWVLGIMDFSLGGLGIIKGYKFNWLVC
jgi:hypothetical protein